MIDGYNLMFYATAPMTFSAFQDFFTKAGFPIYPKKGDQNQGKHHYICVSPSEQYMIYTGKRLFKGYEDYDELLRMQWDLETEGLEPEKDMISQIGIRTNKGFHKIITIEGETREEKFANELEAIKEAFNEVRKIQPDVMSGHNTENFDWNFFDVRLKKHGTSLLDITKPIFYQRGIYKKNKPQPLKLGGEMEYYRPTVMWGHNLTDSLFAVRRAQAIDSNMKKADLKYVTKYSKLNKPNRVYIPGKLIETTWNDLGENYAFSDETGNWFKITNDVLSKTYEVDEETKQVYTLNREEKYLIDNSKNVKYEIVTGRYIGERYLLDDLYETDKVEARYNQSNFLVGKMLPVSFEKMCTMGTAAIWKYIMLAFSYENNLAIPEAIESHSFTGGLSRLLSVGFIDRIVKLDYNSLYPSIILSYDINSPIDIMGAMNSLLEYILTQREHYKELKGKHGKIAKKLKKKLSSGEITNGDEYAKIKQEIAENEMLAARYDKMQLPLKITANAFFGSYGSGSIFPHSDLICAEETTCIGRQCLRLMIRHFSTKDHYDENGNFVRGLGYKPIVGDSFTGDTPIFIKYKESGMIDIRPISELIDVKSVHLDTLGREYDYSEKNFYVLCQSGWVEPTYIYRHKTNKDIYKVTENEMSIKVTEDHSLYDIQGKKISPKDINDETKLLYYDSQIKSDYIPENEKNFSKKMIAISGEIVFVKRKNRISKKMLNSPHNVQWYFLYLFEKYCSNLKQSSTLKAGLNYLRRKIELEKAEKY
jgi:DNA polymerase elongation subunit (family B)